MDESDRIARARMRALGLWPQTQRSPEEVLTPLAAMQAQEHAFARWSVAQRAGGTAGVASASSIDCAFDDGEILRTHVLRPTWHYVARSDLRWLMALSGPRVLARTARRCHDLGLEARTLKKANDVIADAVAERSQTRRDLADVLERNGVSVDGQRLAYIAMHAELTSTICSGPMRGRQHTYAAFDRRVGPACDFRDDEAIAELARRYFTTRGPATLTDFVWWSGLSTREARRGLEMTKEHLSARSTDDRTYWFTETALPRTRGRADLVQCYDEVIISYRESRDVLRTPRVAFAVPRHVDGYTHVVLLDGRLAGHWRLLSGRSGHEIETRMCESLDRKQQRSLAAAVERYCAFREH